MKKVFCGLALAFLTVLGCSAQTANDAETTSASYEIDPGFIGHPLIAKYGYTAEVGAFNIGLGQGAVTNVDNLTDNDPNNSATTTNLANLTVAIDQLVSVIPSDQTNATVYPKGSTVGFTFSSSGSDVSVLDLDVLQMMVFYLYRNGEVVETVNAKADELNVLGLKLISIGGNKQKVTVEAPVDFDGVAIGFGGVKVGVAKELKINYAFIDCFETVPIIKKYYPNVTSKTSGMVTGAKNLVNNDITDGATTAVLNIGGAYYTVLNDEPFPAGIEAGFAMTAGNLLDLNLGKAVQIIGLTYPKNDDGTYNTSAEPIEVDLTSDIGVVGLDLIGGGTTVVSMMTSTDTEVFGFKLNRIAGVDLELGATVVHYAYVKLPATPSVQYPFEINMAVVPSATYEEVKYHAGSATYASTNTYENKIYLQNSTTNPLLIKEKSKEQWRVNVVPGNLLLEDAIRLTLARKARGSEDEPKVVGFIDIFKAESSGSAWTHNKYHYRFISGTTTLSKGELNDPNEDGVIDLSGVVLTDKSDSDNFEFDAETVENSFHKGYEYTLYFTKPTDDADNLDSAYELDYDEVVTPALKPTYEIAGSIDDLSFIEENDGADSYSSTVKPGEYRRYVKLVIPEYVDYKTSVASLKLYKQTDKNKSELVATYTRASKDDNWKADNASYLLGQTSNNGVSEIVFIDNASGTHKYQAVCTTMLTDSYVKNLEADFGEMNFSDGDRTYGWVPVTPTDFTVPTLEYNESTSLLYGPNAHVMTSWRLTLNDAAEGHQHADAEILYNHWSTRYESTSAHSAPKSRANIGGGNIESGLTTKFNQGVNHDFHAATSYDNDNAAHNAKLTAVYHDTNEAFDYSSSARAYIPVVPTNFAGVVNPSYLVTHADSDLYNTDFALTGIEDVTIGTDETPVYYNLQGVRVDNPTSGIYIVVRGTNTTKEVIR